MNYTQEQVNELLSRQKEEIVKMAENKKDLTYTLLKNEDWKDGAIGAYDDILAALRESGE